MSFWSSVGAGAVGVDVVGAAADGVGVAGEGVVGAVAGVFARTSTRLHSLDTGIHAIIAIRVRATGVAVGAVIPATTAGAVVGNCDKADGLIYSRSVGRCNKNPI